MRFPGYLLNPGDMFQVDPELVMYATGAPKTGKQRRGGRRRRVKAKERREKEEQAGKAGAENTAAGSAENKEANEGGKPAAVEGKEDGEEKSQQQEQQKPDEEDHEAHRATLMELLSRAKEITNATAGANRPHKHRADFTEFRRLVRSALSKTTAHTEKGQDISDLEEQFARLTMMVDKENAMSEKARQAAQEQKSEGRLIGESSSSSPSSPSSSQSATTTTTTTTSTSTSTSTIDPTAAELESALMTPEAPSSRALLSSISASDLEILKQALYQVHENPIDTSKAYATPWRPRDYMSAFAFIPRYLEVNQNICAAVYVRHPVVRPGLAEVPTPFPETINQAAFGWYLRRR
ncbi:mitochondrial 37S ribosomal protein nam9 [Ascosphaera aggregata]|nr:mitochondrial 37S ribosomal protein nam9 [Ascosphaera aggregata]